MATDRPASSIVSRLCRAGVKAAVVLVCLGAGVSAVVNVAVDHPRPATVAAAALELGGLALLVVRRRALAAVLIAEVAVAVFAELLAGSVLGGSTQGAVTVALYSLTITDRSWRSAILTGATGVAIGGAEWHRTGDASQLVTCVVFYTAVTAVAFAIRSRRALVDSLRERAEQAEREQQWQTSQAVGAERVRIARELHDVVAHHVSLLVVQAGAVRETLPSDHVTRPVLDSMIDGGRHAMSELREMLDALRLESPTFEPEARVEPYGKSHGSSFAGPAGVPSSPEPGGLAPGRGPSSMIPATPSPLIPQPTVEEIPGLVAGARSAGLPVELMVLGDPAPLAPGTSMAAYRIVQEALTNALKHAPGASTLVELSYRPGLLVATVHNRRPVDTTGRLVPSSCGYGIVGMRERASLAHGTIEVGPVADGWLLRAELPVPADSAAGVPVRA